jgi:ubiquinone/menaquinone biosynthesis C-methylase UbiE
VARHEELTALIRPGVPEPGGTWADLGAGEGAFTRALAELLGPTATIYAVDLDAWALRGLEAAPLAGARIVSLCADFTQHLELPVLDGVLIANALHYARDQAGVLERIAGSLRPGGRLVLVEYEDRTASHAVPYPVPLERFVTLCASAGLEPPVLLGSRASRYGGQMYAALARRSEP